MLKTPISYTWTYSLNGGDPVIFGSDYKVNVNLLTKDGTYILGLTIAFDDNTSEYGETGQIVLSGCEPKINADVNNNDL